MKVAQAVGLGLLALIANLAVCQEHPDSLYIHIVRPKSTRILCPSAAIEIGDTVYYFKENRFFKFGPCDSIGDVQRVILNSRSFVELNVNSRVSTYLVISLVGFPFPRPEMREVSRKEYIEVISRNKVKEGRLRRSAYRYFSPVVYID